MKIKCEVDGEIGEREVRRFSYTMDLINLTALARLCKSQGFSFLDFQILFDGKGDRLDSVWEKVGGTVSFE